MEGVSGGTTKTATYPTREPLILLLYWITTSMFSTMFADAKRLHGELRGGGRE